MMLSRLAFFVFEMNAALDMGKYDHVTVGEVEDHIQNKDLVPWLRLTMGQDVDLSVFDTTSTNELHDGLYDILSGYRGQESRKWGVRQRGVCLLIAWTVEMIQHKRWS
ncbi:MAG TPA: hypothetical protein VF595_15165 [Tepidisphaeraceae bacterium]|jgi:hypothetical protein